MPNLPVIVLECRDCSSRHVELLPRTRLVWCQHCGNVWIVPNEAALQPIATPSPCQLPRRNTRVLEVVGAPLLTLYVVFGLTLTSFYVSLRTQTNCVVARSTEKSGEGSKQ